MALEHLPPRAAWRHEQVRDGFEVVFLSKSSGGYQFEGHASAIEAGEAWAVRYLIGVDASWVTRRARISGRSAEGEHELSLEHDGAGHWEIDGVAAPHLDGCLDVDLESSAFTNALPVHRLGLRVGQEASAPAAYVRAPKLRAERLEQHYARIQDQGEHPRFDYEAPAFGFRCVLLYDGHGLILEYPGIAIRVA